jgi:hypothetical protein
LDKIKLKQKIKVFFQTADNLNDSQGSTAQTTSLLPTPGNQDFFAEAELCSRALEFADSKALFFQKNHKKGLPATENFGNRKAFQRNRS